MLSFQTIWDYFVLIEMLKWKHAFEAKTLFQNKFNINAMQN